MKRLRVAGIFLGLALLGALLRFPQLSLRPMHCDEAVHADKFGTLLEQGRYDYSPEEFHGPTLNYLTLVPAWFQGAKSYIDVTEVTLRAVPAVFGTLLIAAHGLLVPFIGLPAAAAAGLLAALSPAMVFYSRYYIQEMLLVFFTFAALLSAVRYLKRPAAGWALCTGACFGLMHATKETSIIAAACLLAALALMVAVERHAGRFEGSVSAYFRWPHLLPALGAAVLVSALFFSSFLEHPSGIIDSVKSYGTYLNRANSSPWHIHPWHFYLNLLIFSRGPDGQVWTEALILGLAIIGFIASATGNAVLGANPRMSRFLGFYGLLMVLAYSLIPYKTPWCLLGFWHGVIILAGLGIARLGTTALNARLAMLDKSAKAARPIGIRNVARILLLAGIGHLGWQAWAASFRFEADPGNPWVYAHTSRDVFQMVQRVEQLALAHPDGTAIPIQIFSRDNLWPLPWYLRRFSKIGWWNGVSDKAPNAPLILATADMEPALVRKLYELPPPGERELYMNIFGQSLQLRPQLELRGYAVKSLWDSFQQLEAAAGTHSSSGNRR